MTHPVEGSIRVCGICGLAAREPSQPVPRATLERMTAILRHRGPDSCGYHLEPGIGLGVRRLSIVDLLTGDQPIYNEGRNVALICNGEIYNAPELRKELLERGHRFASSSDAEVVVHVYEESGPGCLCRLRGMFAFALWDSSQRLLMLGRDRLGIKPLYYSLTPDGLCFGSEMKSVLLAAPDRPQLDPAAVGDLFRISYVLAPRTIFTGIRHVPPAHYLIYREGACSLHAYWRISFPPGGRHSAGGNAEEWADALADKLQESVRIHLRSDVPLCAWLSGGVDSSGITALAGRISGAPMDTYSLSFEERPYDEVTAQKTLADFGGYVRSNRKVVCRSADFALLPRIVWHCENVSTTGIEILQLLLAQRASEDFKVVLTGEGADEVFGGYSWFKLDKVVRSVARIPMVLRRLMLLGPLLPRIWPKARTVLMAPAQMCLERYRALTVPGGIADPAPPFSADFGQQVAAAAPAVEGQPLPQDFGQWHPFHQLQYFELHVRLPSFLLHMLDRDTMACSLEARVPYLDHEVVEFCAGIPPRLDMKALREKHILREALKGLLPAEIIRRRKRGLRAPVGEWLRGPLPDFAAQMLSETVLRQKGYFDPAPVSALLDQHRRGESGCARPLMACLVVQLWDEIFLSGRSLESGAQGQEAYGSA